MQDYTRRRPALRLPAASRPTPSRSAVISLRTGHHLLLRRLQHRRHRLAQEPGTTSATRTLSAQLGGSYSSAVQRMQQAGTDFVSRCMQERTTSPGPGHPAVRAQGQPAVAQRQRPDVARPVQSLMQGVYFNIRHRPLRRAADPALPGPDDLPEGHEEVRARRTSTTGWPSRAGSRPPCWWPGSGRPGNDLTQANVVNATNQLTNFTSRRPDHAGPTGRRAHTTVDLPDLQRLHPGARATKFVPGPRQGHQVFLCFASRPSTRCNPVPVTRRR